MARFVVDDILWGSAQITAAVIESGLDGLGDRLSTARDRSETVLWHESGYEVPRVGTLSLNFLLHDASSPIPRDLRIELLRRFDSLEMFGDEVLRAIDVRLPDTSVHTAPSVAWACQHQLDHQELVGCITPPFSCRRAKMPIEVLDDVNQCTDVHFVPDDPTHTDFFRQAFTFERVTDVDAFATLAPSAFPELRFVEGVFRGLRDLSQPLRSRRDIVINHLSVLNDNGAAIFARRTNRDIEAGFSEVGLDISPENTGTRNDGACKRERQREYLGETLFFEWHTKIEPHLDRIHVHPGNDKSGSRVIVGIIHRHLRLPGD